MLEAHLAGLSDQPGAARLARPVSFLRRWTAPAPYLPDSGHLERLPGDSLTALRVPSALAGTLTVPIYYIAVMQLSRRRTAFVAALLLALAPMQVEIGQEARMYALLTLWVCGTLVCMVNLLRREAMDSARGFWLGLAVCLAGASYTHNTGGFRSPWAQAPVLAWRWMARRGHEFPQYPASTQGFTLTGHRPGSHSDCCLGQAFGPIGPIVGEFWIQPYGRPWPGPTCG